MSKKDEALKLALEALKKCDSALAEELAAWDIDPPLHHVLEASNACGPAIAAIREALAEQPAPPPPECQTEAEKTAFAFGWWKALEMHRTPAQQQEPFGYFRYDLRIDAWVQNREGQPGTPFYTSPPASKPLTDAQIGAVAADIWGSILIAPQSYQAFARAIEAAHGITGETK